MKQQEVFKKIGGIIKELNDQFEYLKTIDGPLNELELELFLANSHFLGDHVLILTKLNSQNTEVKKKVQKPEAPHEQNFFVPLVHTPPLVKTHDKPSETAKDDNPVPKIDLGASSEDSYSFMHEDEPETIRHELILDEADWVDEDEPYEPNTVHEALKQEIIDEAVPVKEERVTSAVFETSEPLIPEPVAIKEPDPIVHKTTEPAKKEEVLTINERMSAKLAEMAGVGNHGAQSHAISDLKQGITLNDKLLFIKELFNGYSLAYSEAIEILNRFGSFNEAELFLKKNYVVKNTWDKKPETAGKFYDLLKRRYA
jgi:hypothetical protein